MRNYKAMKLTWLATSAILSLASTAITLDAPALAANRLVKTKENITQMVNIELIIIEHATKNIYQKMARDILCLISVS